MRFLIIASISLALASCTPSPKIGAPDRDAAMRMCLEKLDDKIKMDPSVEYGLLQSNKFYDKFLVDAYCQETKYDNSKGYYMTTGKVAYLRKSKDFNNRDSRGPSTFHSVVFVYPITWKANPTQRLSGWQMRMKFLYE